MFYCIPQKKDRIRQKIHVSFCESSKNDVCNKKKCCENKQLVYPAISLNNAIWL